MTLINQYIEKNKERFLDELFGLIRIPSISSLSEHKSDMYRAAEYWKQLLLDAGASRAEVFETDGNPVTYGEKIIDRGLPTVLVYAHMDVMPVDPPDKWVTPPFEPQVRDGRIYARGANDDKGQSMMHAKAFELMVKTGTLPCNVKFMIEGEEEIGSPNLGKFCEQHKEMLQADVILVSDTSMIAPGMPSITTGLRGLAYWQVEVTGPSHDLHSGLFGGTVANPINVLSKLIAGLTDDRGRITIPGFYDDVLEVSPEERAMLARAPFDEKDFMEGIGVKALSGETGYSPKERTGIRPSLDVCGIWGGYTGEGAKTVLPSKAFAKISMRIVPNQDNKKIAKLFEEHFMTLAPKGVKVKVTPHHGGQGFLCPISSNVYKSAHRAIHEVYGIEPVPNRGGGSIPVLADLQQILNANPLLMGFGLERDVIHSPNESYLLSQFYKGIESIGLFYKYYTE